MTSSKNMPLFKFENYVPSEGRTVNDPRWKLLIAKRHFRVAIGLLAGALVGLIYWKFVACKSGTCPLTSNPFKSVIVFAFMGAMMAWDKASGKADAR